MTVRFVPSTIKAMGLSAATTPLSGWNMMVPAAWQSATFAETKVVTPGQNLSGWRTPTAAHHLYMNQMCTAKTRMRHRASSVSSKQNVDAAIRKSFHGSGDKAVVAVFFPNNMHVVCVPRGVHSHHIHVRCRFAPHVEKMLPCEGCMMATLLHREWGEIITVRV